MQGAIANHNFDGIGNNEVNGNCGAKVGNTSLSAMPVEEVFGPAVFHAGDNPKEVLSAQCHPGPVVGFHLGHGHQVIGFQHCFGKPEMAQPGSILLQCGFLEFIPVEVNKGDVLFMQLSPQTTNIQK